VCLDDEDFMQHLIKHVDHFIHEVRADLQ
jgi:hypothetical protein